ncbi:hypothetical protein EKO27_g11516, partial [Xylaria grammica]
MAESPVIPLPLTQNIPRHQRAQSVQSVEGLKGPELEKWKSRVPKTGNSPMVPKPLFSSAKCVVEAERTAPTSQAPITITSSAGLPTVAESPMSSTVVSTNANPTPISPSPSLFPMPPPADGIVTSPFRLLPEYDGQYPGGTAATPGELYLLAEYPYHSDSNSGIIATNAYHDKLGLDSARVTECGGTFRRDARAPASTGSRAHGTGHGREPSAPAGPIPNPGSPAAESQFAPRPRQQEEDDLQRGRREHAWKRQSQHQQPATRAEPRAGLVPRDEHGARGLRRERVAAAEAIRRAQHAAEALRVAVARVEPRGAEPHSYHVANKESIGSSTTIVQTAGF